MLYRHTVRFQILMQLALKSQSHQPLIREGREERYSDARFAEMLQLTIKGSSIQKFRATKFPEFESEEAESVPITEYTGAIQDLRNAGKIWDYLSQNGLIHRAIPGGKVSINKQKLYTEREVSNALMSFYDADEAKVDDFSERGLASPDGEPTEWFCYKPSFRKKGFLVKSRMTFEYFQGEYFKVFEMQRSSGRFELSGEVFGETSTGLAFSKTDKLWCFMREMDRNQPRIICFHHMESAEISGAEGFISNGNYSVMYGNIIEAGSKFGAGFYASPIIMVSKKYDEDQWRRRMGKAQYNEDAQLDIFPYTEEAKNEEKWKADKDYYIPNKFLRYFEKYMTDKIDISSIA